MRPSCANATEDTPLPWAFWVFMLLPSCMFQSLMVPSLLALASTLPSSRKATSVIASL